MAQQPAWIEGHRVEQGLRPLREVLNGDAVALPTHAENVLIELEDPHLCAPASGLFRWHGRNTVRQAEPQA